MIRRSVKRVFICLLHDFSMFVHVLWKLSIQRASKRTSKWSQRNFTTWWCHRVFLPSLPAGAGSKNVRQLALRRIRSSAQLTLAHFFVFVFAHSPLACWLLQVGIILEMSSSMAGLVSYNVGACKMIPDVPTEEEGGVRYEHFLLSLSIICLCFESLVSWVRFEWECFVVRLEAQQQFLACSYWDFSDSEDILLSHTFGNLDITLLEYLCGE